ncbi:hypothetical protein HHI36_017833 [Cryptolaemus montrouzieri]|uniref:E3 ubiquitin-protein ligase listerin n=1 Tax=Cryptolaemus montrouzieri TaxID=559131 RepID=A0ABD2NNY8_9CUCU
MLISLCRAIHKGIPLQMDKILKNLFQHSVISQWRNLVQNVCKSAEYLKGNLSSCYDEFKMESELQMDNENVLHFFTWSHLIINVLTASLDEFKPDDEEEDEEEADNSIWTVLDSRIDWICDILYDFELARCFWENFKTVQFAFKLKEYNDKDSSKCSEMVKILSDHDKNDLRKTLRCKSYSNSWIWCKTIYNFHVNLSSEEPTKVYDDLVKDATINDKLLVLHATQVFAEHLNFDYVAHTFDDVSRMIVLRSLSRSQEIDVQIAEVMSKLEIFRTDNLSRFNCESFKIDWQSYQIILEAARLFNELVKHHFDSLSRRYIDLIVISLAEWLPRLVQFCKTEKVQPMIIAVTNLHQSIIEKINDLKTNNTKIVFTKEWDDLFAEGIQNDSVKLWLALAGSFKDLEKSIELTNLPLMYCFASMANSFDYQLIFKKSEEKPPRWSRVLKESRSLLTSSLTTLQLAAYKALMSLIPGLVEIDSIAVDTNTPNKHGLIFEQFKEICLSMQDIINTMLIGLKLGEDSCHVQPFTDSYNYTLAYLLIWDVLLTLCEKATTELKYQYADWLRQEDILKNLFNNLFRMMPTEILHYSESKKLFHLDWFSARACLDVKDVCTSTKLEHMVCWVYFLTLSQLPALVRQWWSGTETRIAQIVERITSAYVSPLLCNQELADISRHEKKFKNMTIRVMPTVREIVAIYTVDEAQMELVITLPTNYPLAGPEVHCNRQIGGTSHKQWLMQFKKCVLHQNGRIWDGLSLWNNNLDKKFDGVEECYICFSVLHPGTYQLPKLSCQTCKKKFHSACLYKWFSTSNKSSCPICRNLF